MRCSKCGSESVSSIVNTNTKTKGFGGGKACCGYALFGWIGVLCGLCGMGETDTETKVTNVCNSCGKKF